MSCEMSKNVARVDIRIGVDEKYTQAVNLVAKNIAKPAKITKYMNVASQVTNLKLICFFLFACTDIWLSPEEELHAPQCDWKKPLSKIKTYIIWLHICTFESHDDNR